MCKLLGLRSLCGLDKNRWVIGLDVDVLCWAIDASWVEVQEAAYTYLQRYSQIYGVSPASY